MSKHSLVQAMKRKFTVVVQRDEDGGYIGSIPELPGCLSQGNTREELMQHMQEAAELWLEVEGEPSATVEICELRV